MNKKIIIAVALLALVVGVFAACKGKEENPPKEKPTGMEITTDEEGNAYVVNTDGDLIPFTTDEDGYFPLPDELFTKSHSEFVSESEAASKGVSEKPTDIIIPGKTDPATESNGKPTKPVKPTKPEGSTKKPISVDNQGGDAVIDWNDIKPR